MKNRILTVILGAPVFLLAFFVSAIVYRTVLDPGGNRPLSDNLIVLFVLASHFFVFTAVGAFLGYKEPANGWTWGLWLAVLPTIYLLFVNLTKPTSNENFIWATLGYTPFAIVIPVLAGCIGSYIGGRLKGRSR